jgi:16S rRNA (adenine1518-N6/adenine1519-N6)-dimethyltransferase
VRQRLGQHFLRDAKVVQTILAGAELSPLEDALEIGPGKAVLTEPLAARVRHLTAVELDRSLAAELRERFKASAKMTLVEADFLGVDLDALFPSARQSPIKVLGNLPYAVTAPIFEKLLAWPGWRTGVFLIQREVAARIEAKAGSKAFGILSLAVQVFAEAESLLTVPPGAFAPPPEVTSRVIRLRRRAAPLVSEDALAAYFSLAKSAFAHRRKTMVNSLAMSTKISKEKIAAWLRQQAIDPEARAESVALENYVHSAPFWAIFRREN